MLQTFYVKDISRGLAAFHSKNQRQRKLVAMLVKSLRLRFLAILLFAVFVCYIFMVSKKSEVHDSVNGVTKKTHQFDTVLSSKESKTKENKQVTLAETLRNVPKIKVKAVNCRALFVGNPLEKQKAAEYHAIHKSVVYRHNIPEKLDECDSYLSSKEFAREPADAEEAEFPMAFSILVYKDFHQFEKLLRAVYRPQNYYCIHVDLKSDPEFKKNVQLLVNCFNNENVFISPVSYDVQWATMTVLKPEIECMKELWNRFAVNWTSSGNDDDDGEKKRRRKPLWKYFINLTGQEFPLRTNLEIVRILKIFNGSNNVEATRARMQESTVKYYDERPAPGNLKIWKGSVHVVLSREFVDAVVHHPISEELLKYLNDVWVPDEHFFSTLNNNPNFTMPGGYIGKNPETDSQFNRFIVRFKNWGYPPFAWPCKGKWVRQICNFGIGDLPLLASRDELFANKFDYNFEPLAYDCMEELLYNRTKLEFRRGFYQKKEKELEKNKKPSTEEIDFMDEDENLPKRFNESEIKNIVEKNMKEHPDLADRGLQNKDHLIFPDKTFYVYGDELDGQYGAKDPEKTASLINHYLHSVRPTIHEPGEVDFDHYKDLDFVRNHFHVPDYWTFQHDYEQQASSSKEDLSSGKIIPS